MSTTEILAELSKLNAGDLAVVQAKLDELAGDAWRPGDVLSEADRVSLDGTLAAYATSPEAGDSWGAVKARVQAKLRP